MTEEEQVRHDGILAAVFSGSSLLAFALSFGLTSDDGRPILFSVLIVISIICLWKAKSKMVLIAAALFVLITRLIWVAIATRLGGYN